MSKGYKQAFPGRHENGIFICRGMTVREWYAGMALMGYCSSLSQTKEKFTSQEIALWSVGAADAVIAELEESK